jgi:23S rRNA pseudouridine955/2504/2580 synthase/23S rRNA pseudouridine1911/1915/1917 synthase
MLKLQEHILLENEDFVVVNKPAGLLSIPDRTASAPSLKDLLIQRYDAIFTVHRLDRETSGAIVFAKHEAAHKELSQLFEGRDVAKYYQGLVNGVPVPPEGNIDAPIMEHFAKNGRMMIHAKGKPSLTDYEVLESFRMYSWVKFRIHTGRTHQIRVHMQSIGNSIVCDELYGNPEPVFISKLKRNYNLSKSELEEQPILKRLALHAALLQFTFKNIQYSLEAPLPKDLRALLQQLRKWNS